MTDHWLLDEKRRKAFHVSLYMRLCKIHILQDSPSVRMQPYKDDAYGFVYNRIKEAVDFKSTNNAAEAVELAIRWAQANLVDTPTHEGNIVNVTCSVTRHYGPVSITYGLAADYNMSSLATLPAAFDELRTLIETHHDLSASNNPALMPKSATQETGGLATMEVYCPTLRIEFVDNKKRFRLLGGDFSEFGIPVYDEYLTELKIPDSGLDYGDHAYNKNVLVQLNGNGKPKRALKCLED